jgi:predicted 3-demethylubiquinone-9 3-methyltransferase (glyoxalase superfamily)
VCPRRQIQVRAATALRLDGQKFVALNGGSYQKFNDAVSFFVSCDTQAEIDEYWSKLTDGGSEIHCGWLRDKFGLCRQVVPERIGSLIKNPKAMKKLDLAELERAANS